VGGGGALGRARASPGEQAARRAAGEVVWAQERGEEGKQARG
jgi:hypothetical protein